MKKCIVVFIMLALGLSCNSKSPKDKLKLNSITSDKTTVKAKAKENIRFDFSVDSVFEDMIEIKAELYNENTDTVCFLSSSCYGEQYSLRYDASKFELTSLINCNASYPRLITIAPKGKREFKANFKRIGKQNHIKLGFDFYDVGQSFDLSKISLYQIHNRPENKQTVLWASEKKIE